jgi:hypothetical protein
MDINIFILKVLWGLRFPQLYLLKVLFSWAGGVYPDGSPTFRRNEMPQCSGSKSKPSNQQEADSEYIMMASWLVYTSSLQTEAVRSVEVSITFYRTTRRHDSNLLVKDSFQKNLV